MTALQAMERIENIEGQLSVLRQVKKDLEKAGEFSQYVIQNIIDEKVTERNALADKLRAVQL